MSDRHARIEVVPVSNLRSQRGRHYLRLRASNGQILAHSEVYASKRNAIRAAHVAWRDAFADLAGIPEVREVDQ